MKKYNVPYDYIKAGFFGAWILALLNIASTWINSAIANSAAFCFNIIVSTFLLIVLLALSIMLLLSNREGYQKRAYIFGGLWIVHLVMYIVTICLTNKLQISASPAIYAISAVHMIDLLAIIGFGCYFWIRNRFTFKSQKEQEVVAAFGGPIEEPKQEQPVQPEEPKQARDEKTGIVSL